METGVDTMAIGDVAARNGESRVSAKYLYSDAYFSRDGRYRYWLSRRIGMGEKVIMFVGLNPSTADARMDDPTIRRCVGFASGGGFDILLMTNLHGFRATQPQEMMRQDDPVGPENETLVKDLANDADKIVAAWGSNPLAPAAQSLATWILGCPQTVCLGQNKDGSPKHPLYLAKNTAFRKMELAA